MNNPPSHSAGALQRVLLAFALSPLPLHALAPGQQANACDARSTLRAADQNIKQGNVPAARALIGRLRGCPGMAPMELFTLGRFYGRVHDFHTALGIFAKVDPSIPSPQAHAYAVALSYFELVDYKNSVSTLKNLQAAEVLDEDSANLLAVSYSKLGQYQDAYTLLLQQLREHPKDLYAYFNLITLLADAGRLPDALTVADQAVEAFPADAEVFIVRGAAYTLLSQREKARQDFSTAVTLADKKARPYFLLAMSDYTLGNYSVAGDEIKTAIASGVVDADLEYLLAECTIKLDADRVDEAIASLNKAIAIDGKAVPALTLRGKLLLARGEKRAAAADLEAAHRLDPAMRSATYNLARAYMAFGRQKDAAALYHLLDKQSTDAVTELSDRNMKQALGASAPR